MTVLSTSGIRFDRLPPFHYTMQAKVQEISSLDIALRAWADAGALPEKTTFHLALIMDELLTNIAAYGKSSATREGSTHSNDGGNGNNDGAGGINVTVSIRHLPDDATLEIRVRDSAGPFDPSSIAHPDVSAPLESREPGGLGIYFVRQLTRSIDYRRHENGNEWILLKEIVSGP